MSDPLRPTVTAVIPHYFSVREAALAVVIESLKRSTHRPAAIHVWDNTAQLATGRSDVWISPSPNIGPQGRFLAALQAQTDYVLFLDNDVAVDAEAVANLLARHAALDQGVLAIATLEGRQAGDARHYRDWVKVYGHGCTSPVRVAVSLGRGELVPTAILPRLLQHFPFQRLGVMDDLWFSACAAKEQIPIYVVPCVKGVSSLHDLPRHGTGLSAEPGYYAARSAAIQDIQTTLGVWRAD